MIVEFTERAMPEGNKVPLKPEPFEVHNGEKFSFFVSNFRDENTNPHHVTKEDKTDNGKDDETKKIEKIVEKLGLAYYFLVIDDSKPQINSGKAESANIEEKLPRLEGKDVGTLLAKLGFSSQDIAKLFTQHNENNRISLKNLLDFMEKHNPLNNNKQISGKFLNELLQNAKTNMPLTVEIDPKAEYSFDEIKQLLQQLNSNYEKAATNKNNGVIAEDLQGSLQHSKTNGGKIDSHLTQEERNKLLQTNKKQSSLVDSKFSKKENSEISNSGNLKTEHSDSHSKLQELNQTESFTQAKGRDSKSQNFSKIQVERDNIKLSNSTNEIQKPIDSKNIFFSQDDHFTDLGKPFSGKFSDRTQLHSKDFDQSAFSITQKGNVNSNNGFFSGDFNMGDFSQQDANSSMWQQIPLTSNTTFQQQLGNITGTLNFLSPTWTTQLATYIQKVGGETNNKIIIQLEPPELGKLTIRLQSRANKIITKILTEHEEVKNMLEKNQNILKQHLADLGLQLENFKVDVGINDSAHRNFNEDMGHSDNLEDFSPIRSRNNNNSGTTMIGRNIHPNNNILYIYA